MTQTADPTDTKVVRAFSITVDRAALSTRAESDERIPIAISSEFPVKRYDWQRDERFDEVLDHTPASVNLGRATRGLPFIPSHQSYGSDVFGKVEEIRVDADKVMRGWVRFSKSPRAQEIRQDMLDDIRTEVSVGYDPGDEYTETRDGDTLTRRYTNWTPYEVSTVSVPADPTVGKGRAHSAPASITPQPAVTGRSEPMSTEQVVAAPVAPASAPGVSDVRSRNETIYSYAIAAGLSSSETQALVSSGRDIDAIGRELLEKMNSRAEHSGAPKPAVELTEKEQQRYSLMGALNSIVGGKRGFEMEVSDEFAKKTGRSYTNDKSFFLPLNLRTQLSVGASGKGPELRATELRPELIDLLRQRSLVIGTLGARFMPGLVGNVAFPRQTAGMAATWVAEAPGSDMALSSLSLDQVTLSPKTLQASTTVSRQLLAQSTPAADQIVFDDLIAQAATAIDMAALYGSGASNQPTGVGVATGTNLIAMGTNGAQATLTKVYEALRALETSNAMVDGITFVTTPGIKYSMAGVVRFASTDSRTLWDIDTNSVVGVPAFSTNNMPSTLTKGSASGVAHAAIVGDFSQVMVGEWGSGTEIIVDPFTLARRNLIQITSIQFADVQIRTPASFSVFRDLLV
jgi:HK97 family phage major capsid protein